MRGGYVDLSGAIHHARIYRIEGKKPAYAMVRVFQVDLLRLKGQDLFTTALKPSTISMRAADPKIRKALASNTAKQIGWLVRGDELLVDTSAYPDGKISHVMTKYPETIYWKVAGFPESKKIKMRPYLLSKEGLSEDTEEPIRTVVDIKGWITTIQKLFEVGAVKVIRRNCLGEERWCSSASLPVSMILE